MGYRLAETIQRQLHPEELKEIDAVIPIPETSLVSAYAVSKHLKKPYCQGFVKNRYIFRTFIMPSQGARQRGVRAKLNVSQIKIDCFSADITVLKHLEPTTCSRFCLRSR